MCLLYGFVQYRMLPLLCYRKAFRSSGPQWRHMGAELGPKLLIGIILTSCNYSPAIHSYCSGFNEQAITQPTIIITRTIKHDGYSLVKRSHMWKSHILHRTLADRGTQTWAKTDRQHRKQKKWGGRKTQMFSHKWLENPDEWSNQNSRMKLRNKLLLYGAVSLSYFCTSLSDVPCFLFTSLYLLNGFLCITAWLCSRDRDPSCEWPQ